MKNKTFAWEKYSSDRGDETDLLGHHVKGALVIPNGWSQSLVNGDPKPLVFYLDGSDTNTADVLEGSVHQSLGDFQMKERDATVEGLPGEVYELGEKLPVEVRKVFVSLMEPWTIERKVLYNPKTRFIDYVVPGIIGLILQLLTVTLMACTIARERESGTLYQLLVTSLQRGEIVIGKILPYLAVSIVLIVMITIVAGLHFQVRFYGIPMLAVICLLFLVCSLGLGLLISTFSRSQTQAIQFSVFFLLPVFVLSGAFAPLEQLPKYVRYVSELFSADALLSRLSSCEYVPRRHPILRRPTFWCCSPGAIITFVGAAILLRRMEE